MTDASSPLRDRYFAALTDGRDAGDRAPFRRRVGLILGVLLVANLGAWLLALKMTSAYPVLISSAFLAYGLGLRHAFDADHIAAIDNVTRRLVEAGARPAGVGFFFSLGHSTVVVGASIGIALAASHFKAALVQAEAVIGPFGQAFSSLFLFSVAALNVLVFAGVWRRFRQTRSSDWQSMSAESDRCVAGLFSSRLKRVLDCVNSSWMMYPLGLVFALGFDTATEVGLLGLAAAQAAKGLPLWSILIFPALFASAMALADTVEALFMLSAYRWSSRRPGSRLYYNLAITAASVLIAVTIGAGQLVGLAPRLLRTQPLLRWGSDGLAQNSEWIGLAVVGMFAVVWGSWALADGIRGPRIPSR